MPHSAIDHILLESGDDLLLEDGVSVYPLESAVATLLPHRRGGIRWLREPDPEIREGKEQELAELVKPNLAPDKPSRAPKSSARLNEPPPGPLLTSVQDAAARMTRPEQARLERLLAQTGISLRELLILLE